MRGSLRKRATTRLGLKKGEFSWSLIVTLGRDPITKKWKQKWVTFHGTEKQARIKLAELTTEVNKRDFIEPTKLTLGEWLEKWLTKVQGRLGERSYNIYRNAVHSHIAKHAIASIRLQQLTPSDIEAYHHDKVKELAHATLDVHHLVLSSALKLAKRDKLVRDNVAREATERPGRGRRQRVVKAWSADEAQKLLAAAKETNPQAAAFIAVALDSGARKAELQGVKWSDVDLTTGALRIERQLLKAGENPVFGDTKTRMARSLDLCEETLVLLREHKRKQSETKLANRLHYAEHNLVFTQDWEHQGKRGFWQLGAPLTVSTISTMLTNLVKKAGVRRLTVHSLRHTCATLSLAAGVQSDVVQKRLGHRSIVTTLDIYANAWDGQQAQAAARLSPQLHGPSSKVSDQ